MSQLRDRHGEKIGPPGEGKDFPGGDGLIQTAIPTPNYRLRAMNQNRGLSARERELRGQGWTRQFVANEPRLTEAIELYQATGHEVHLEPLATLGQIDPNGCDDCTACFNGFEEQYRVIYTRPKRERTEPEDDLW